MKIKLPKITISREQLGIIAIQSKSILRFLAVASTFLIAKFFKLLSRRIPGASIVSSRFKSISEKLDKDRPYIISRGDVVELALANLRSKKSRTYITIGGVVVGITTVVLLVSIGYGLQQMVVSRVARLDEMRQIDVYTQSGSKLKITDKTLSDIQEIQNVETALPLISVVGRVNYQKSVSDLAVYGVTTAYLEQSAIQPVRGKLFKSDDLSNPTNQPGDQVRGISFDALETEAGVTIREVSIVIDNNVYLKLRESADRDSKLVGYISQPLGDLVGKEVWGQPYEDEQGNGRSGTNTQGDILGKWVLLTAPLYDLVDGEYIPRIDDNNSPVQSDGYVAEINLSLSKISPQLTQVLGETTTASPTQPAIQTIKAGWVEIASESAAKESLTIDTIDISASALKEAVVNRAMLNVLGLKEGEAVGKLFDVSFVVTGNLLNDDQKRLESNPVQYKIVGVTPDTRAAQFFVAFMDIRSLGVTNYSQVKVIVKNQKDLPAIRRQIEEFGYKTRSVVDTVNQINQLFGTLRVFLAILGLVALFVASVGMFNTLTVSLMERTREVGLMKAMGMRSHEIKELFLAESLIMSGAGGVLGIFLGVLIGKLIEIALSSFAIFKGAGYVNITYTPPLFAISIVALALLVGLITGFYPSRRATKISALDALRYE